MLNTAKDWALNVLVVGLIGTFMVAGGVAVGYCLLCLQQAVMGVS